MQKNESGFKMEFKKRNPEFRKPSRKAQASSHNNNITTSGDLRKHDKPTRAMKKQDVDSSSSSEEDIIETKRKAEIANQKSEQAKLVEMALLEQVMNGQIDVMELLKSGQIDSSALREQIQKSMAGNIDGTPVPEQVSLPPQHHQQHHQQHHEQQQHHHHQQQQHHQQQHEQQQHHQQHEQQQHHVESPQVPVNPLLRNRNPSDLPPITINTDRNSKKKGFGGISSESSESSESSSDSEISSESDSDEDSHKLAKKVKKLKAKNKKLAKKVKTLKKRLKDKKSEDKPPTTIPRTSKPEVAKNQPQPPLQNYHGAVMAPMTPQQFAAQQSEVRRQYDPQTGQYRDSPGPPALPLGMPLPPPGLLMPSLPSLPQLPMPSGPIPMYPPTSTGGFESSGGFDPDIPRAGGFDPDIIEIKSSSAPLKEESDEDLYGDVFQEKQKEVKSKPRRESQGKPIPSTVATKQYHPPGGPGYQGGGQQVVYQGGQQSQQSGYQPQQSGYQRPQSTESGYSEEYASHQPRKEERRESGGGRRDSGGGRRDSESGEIVVRSKFAKDLIKEFYDDGTEVIDGSEDAGSAPKKETPILNKSETTSCRGVTFSGQCHFCNRYHTVSGKSDAASLCSMGRKYLEKFRIYEKRVKELRDKINSNTDKLISLKNKRELMAKVIVDNDVKKNERSANMAVYRQYILSLPQPVKVSQELGKKIVRGEVQEPDFGKKIVRGEVQEPDFGDKLKAAIDKGNDALQQHQNPGQGGSRPGSSRERSRDRGRDDRGRDDRGSRDRRSRSRERHRPRDRAPEKTTPPPSSTRPTPRLYQSENGRYSQGPPPQQTARRDPEERRYRRDSDLTESYNTPLPPPAAATHPAPAATHSSPAPGGIDPYPRYPAPHGPAPPPRYYSTVPAYRSPAPPPRGPPPRGPPRGPPPALLQTPPYRQEGYRPRQPPPRHGWSREQGR